MLPHQMPSTTESLHNCAQRFPYFHFLVIIDVKLEVFGRLKHEHDGRPEVEFAEHFPLENVDALGVVVLEIFVVVGSQAVMLLTCVCLEILQ